MSTIEFVVEDTFDVPGRAGLLVGGHLGGEVQQGTILRDRLGAEARVVGVEFGTASMLDAGRAALLLARDHGLDLTPGSVLVGVEPD